MPCRPCISLRCFPNAAVGIPLGLGGQAILWKNLQTWPWLKDLAAMCEAIQWVFFVACCTVLLGVILVYAAKAMVHRDVVKKELQHPIRFNFFLGPCIAICMLGISIPTSVENPELLLQVLWTIAFFYQLSAAIIVYRRWLYLSSVSEMAAPPYLLSLVSWFLLCILGTPAKIDSGAGMPLRAMCFGIGSFFSLYVYPSILVGIFAGRSEAGSPALFLMLAPLSVAGIGLIGLNGGIGVGTEAIFGLVLVLFLILVTSGPKIWVRPSVLGVYWAYVFPNAALATLSIKIAEKYMSALADGLAVALSVVAIIAFLLVLVRMSLHIVQVCRGLDSWTDPIVTAMDAAPAAEEGRARASSVGSDGSCGEERDEAPTSMGTEMIQRIERVEELVASMPTDASTEKHPQV